MLYVNIGSDHHAILYHLLRTTPCILCLWVVQTVVVIGCSRGLFCGSGSENAAEERPTRAPESHSSFSTKTPGDAWEVAKLWIERGLKRRGSSQTLARNEREVQTHDALHTKIHTMEKVLHEKQASETTTQSSTQRVRSSVGQVAPRA